METRDILNSRGEVVGQMSLPDGTSEEVWQEKLSRYLTPDIPSPLEQAKQKVEEAKVFGKKISDDFIAENLLLGITQLGLTNHVRKTLQEVKDALETGSIYDAITEIKNLNSEDFDETILTENRILLFRRKIEQWLGVPYAVNWNDPETWL